MPSVVTSIIGGIQGASAAHNAANTLSNAYNTAGQTVTQAAAAVNPTITNAASTGANQVVSAGQTAGQGVVSAAQTGTAALSPYTANGTTAANQLTGALQPGGQLNTPFTAQTMAQYSPGYQFQLAQGQNALTRQMAASGLSGSGGALKAAAQYGQNFASTAYQNAFQDYTTQNQNLFNNLNQTAQLGAQTGEFGANLNTGAAQYAGTTGVGTSEYGAGMNYGAATTTAQNTLSAANYQANTQIGAGQAQAQADLGAANSWNSMLGGIGTAANTLLTAGMSGGGGFLQNVGSNLFGMQPNNLAYAGPVNSGPTGGADNASGGYFGG